MKTTYIVPRMDTASYNSYMSGGNNYHVDYARIQANSPEEAIDLAKGDDWVVNEYDVKTVDEYEKELKDFDAAYQAAVAKNADEREKRKIRKQNNLLKKAAEAGVSPEDAEEWGRTYNKLKQLGYDISRREGEISRIQSQIDELRKYYAEVENKLNSFTTKNSFDSVDTESNKSLLDKFS